MLKTHCEIFRGYGGHGIHRLLHNQLFAFLCSEWIACVVINPLLISNFARLSWGRPNDQKDALTIAQSFDHRSKLSQVSYFRPSGLQDLARERESLAVMMAGWRTDVRRICRWLFRNWNIDVTFYGDDAAVSDDVSFGQDDQDGKAEEISKAWSIRGKRKRVFIRSGRYQSLAKVSVALTSIAGNCSFEKIEDTLYLEGKKKGSREAF